MITKLPYLETPGWEYPMTVTSQKKESSATLLRETPNIATTAHHTFLLDTKLSEFSLALRSDYTQHHWAAFEKYVISNRHSTWRMYSSQCQMSLRHRLELSCRVTIGKKSATSYPAPLPIAYRIASWKNFSALMLKPQILRNLKIKPSKFKHNVTTCFSINHRSSSRCNTIILATT
jgi:hypothetical protein